MWKRIVSLACEVGSILVSLICAALCLARVTFPKPVLFIVFIVLAACPIVARVFDPAFKKQVTTATGG